MCALHSSLGGFHPQQRGISAAECALELVLNFVRDCKQALFETLDDAELLWGFSLLTYWWFRPTLVNVSEFFKHCCAGHGSLRVSAVLAEQHQGLCPGHQEVRRGRQVL